MNDIRTPGDPGQNLESSRPLHSRPAPLNEAERAQIQADLLESLERTAEIARKLNPSKAVVDAPVVSLGPPFAVRTDGVLLMNVEHLGGIDLARRPVWAGVELEPDEAVEVAERLQNAAHETAASLAGRLLSSAKGQAVEPRELPEGGTQNAPVDENPEHDSPSPER